MRISPKMAVTLAGLVFLVGCDTAVEAPETSRGAAVVMSDQPSQGLIATAANQAGERVDALYPTELRDASLGENIVQRYTEIASPFEGTITAGEATSNLDWILNRVASAPSSALTSCARTELT